ncbi:MAG: TFIIB-type zinc ribbon-containing protein [Solirubrobacteraceae bacterium]
MRTYERNGVVVDQCRECRGIFLDRGELEQLVDAELGDERRDEQVEHHRDRHDHDHEDDHDYQTKGRGSRRPRASSFLSDLLGGGE